MNPEEYGPTIGDEYDAREEWASREHFAEDPVYLAWLEEKAREYAEENGLAEDDWSAGEPPF